MAVAEDQEARKDQGGRPQMNKRWAVPQHHSRYMSFVEILRKIPLWVIPLVIGTITFLNTDIRVASDMGWYMNSALNLSSGRGYVDMDHSPIIHRGPSFPLMIALAFQVLGVSIPSAFWVVRIFAILNPVLAFLIGRRFYNSWVGLVGSLLILTSYSVNYWSYRHLDHVWPFFVLLAILLIDLAFEKRRLLWAILAGASMGIAFLIKEVVIVLLPFPLLTIALIRSYRHRVNVGAALAYMVIFFIILSPWAIYVYQQAGSLKPLLGFRGPTVGQELFSPEDGVGRFDPLALPANYLRGLLDYFFNSSHEHSLIRNFSLMPLFLFAWGFAFWMALKGDKGSIVFIIIFALYSPVMAHFGMNNMRLGQGILFFFVTYLILAEFLLKLGERVTSTIATLRVKREAHPSLHFAIATSIAMLCLIVQMFVGEAKDIEFLKGSILVNMVFDQDEGYSAGRYNRLTREVGNWLSRHAGRGEGVLVSKHSEGRPIYFFSGGNVPIYVMPVVQSDKLQGITRKEGAIVFLSAWIPQVDPRNRFFALAEADLLQFIHEHGIKYVIVTQQRNFLALYFDANPGFIQVAEFGGGQMRIYKVDRIIPLNGFDTLVAVRAILYLRALKRQDPQGYRRVVKTFFHDVLGWSSDTVERVEAGNYGMVVREWYIYSRASSE